MLDIIKMNFPGFGRLTSGMQKKTKWSFFDAILLGLVFALAFCLTAGYCISECSFP